MDPYSEILSGLKLQGAIFFRAEFSAPWFINAPPSPQLAAALGIENAHVVNFHLLTEGEANVDLVTSAVNMPVIAAQVGYESEAAFSRAFSRELGMPPARYRSMNKPSPEGGRG